MVKESNAVTKSILVSGLTGVVCIVLLLTAFEKNKGTFSFTCSKYILNTYLYVFLSILFTLLFVSTFMRNKLDLVPNLTRFFGIFFLSLAVLFFTIQTNPNNTGAVIIKHILWLAFILCLALLFYPVYTLHSNTNIMITSALTTLFLVLILSFVAFKRPDLISLSWGPVLFTILLTVIIFEVVTMLLFPKIRLNRNGTLNKVMAYIVIILFMFYILYDTKMMTIRAKKCNNNADYINESLNLFLDIFNIFARMLSLSR